MSVLRVVGFAVIVLAARPVPGESCTVVEVGVACQAYWAVDAVFVGTAISVQPHRPGEESFTRRVQFSVSKSYRGVTTQVVDVLAGHGAGDCGYHFTAGETYLVFATRSGLTKLLTAQISTVTKLVSEAHDDLAYLDGLHSRGLSTRAFGRVTQYASHPSGNGQQVGTPVPGVTVTLSGHPGVFTSVTRRAWRVLDQPAAGWQLHGDDSHELALHSAGASARTIHPRSQSLRRSQLHAAT